MTADRLFHYADHVDPRRVHARTLLVTLGGFGDPGRSQQNLVTHLLNTLPNHELGEFDADRIIDYRDQRPTVMFQRDHFSGYSRPTIRLHKVTDSDNTNFLLLSGPEPALAWEQVAAEIEQLVDDHDVQLVVIGQATGMPTPHTRPTMVTRWASRPELLPDNQPLFGNVIMNANFPAVLTTRLGEAHHDVIGASAHVPHYVADGDYPDGALTLLREVSQIAGLDLPTGELESAASMVRAHVSAQVSQSEEMSQLIDALEQQYDHLVQRRPLSADAENLPTAEEIGRAAEEYLAGLNRDAEAASGDRPDTGPDDGPGPAADGPTDE